MRLSEHCSSQDVDRAIAVTVESFVGAQKVACKKALSRAFAKYVSPGSIHSLFCSYRPMNVYILGHTYRSMYACESAADRCFSSDMFFAIRGRKTVSHDELGREEGPRPSRPRA